MQNRTCANCHSGQPETYRPRCGLCAGPNSGPNSQWKPIEVETETVVAVVRTKSLLVDYLKGQATVDTVTKLVCTYPATATAYAQAVLEFAEPAFKTLNYEPQSPDCTLPPSEDKPYREPFKLFCYRVEQSLYRFYSSLNKSNNLAIAALHDATLYAAILSGYRHQEDCDYRPADERDLKNFILDKILY